ncbi:flagellin [Bradyrhizobium erythrophlei]|uniref:Flagellin N-terminal helical region n=1 Tax=Bradyrhizobium erythrophlei TaxID=1437360 RepID=A0A1M5I6U0_9BRAD|nr:flagellin [Bradyrhizobium erythrophlei]SHG24011.1 flagellin N-terminal helical region [Bradyrhizobium erythrophlei]
MSGIVLSASVRQNLLSLQSTASLLATTQNDLATGNKVNSALDNPTNFFTAQGLNNRASDINNLLDSIGNGVQVLQAANTGITSLQGLVASAQSIANQVLQSPVGYTTKSNVTSTAITGATANNLLGPGTAGSVTAGAVATTINLGSSGSIAFSVAVDAGTAKTITLSSANVTAYNTANGTSLNANSLSASDVANLTNYQFGSTVASVSGGKLVFTSGTTGTSSSVTTTAEVVTGGATGTTGVAVGTNAGTNPSLQGETLTIGATGGGTATSITFGTGNGQISTLNALNTALAANNLQASISTTGQINIATTNNAASSTIGTIGGTAAASGAAFNGLTAAAAVADPNSQATRASLVAQYNNVLQQINTTAQDSSFNGVNLLNGDTLNLTFDETGASKLAISGVTFNTAGLSLSTLTAGTDFLDNNSANKALTALSNASTTLRSEASALGSNLSIVQIRQDFNKNLINVLQTGSSNLTLADPNQEAANSQALSTRQSIAVSALALANQSQQSVLQLLR